MRFQSAIRIGCLKPFIRVSSGGGGGSIYIRSIQEVSVAINPSAVSGTATITSVGPLAFVVYGGIRTPDAGQVSSGLVMSGVWSMFQLTNPTTVTLSRNTSAASSVAGVATVIDPTSALVQSIEQGTVTIGAGGGTTTTKSITSVDISRSAVFFLGSKGMFQFGAEGKTRAYLASPSTITIETSATVSQALNTLEVGYVVVQFATSAIRSVQAFTPTLLANTSVTNSQTITSVVADNTLIAYGGHNISNVTNPHQTFTYTALANPSIAVVVRGSAEAIAVATAYTVVEFTSGVLKSPVQRGLATIASGGTAGFVAIASVCGAQSFINYLGTALAATSANERVNKTLASMKLTAPGSATAIRVEASTSPQMLVSYEVIEFN